MTDVTIYHNPRCSKSRQTLALLEARGVNPTIVRYLEQTPSISELRTLLHKLQLTPAQLLRSNETEYREQGLDQPGVTDEQILQAMQAHPRLIQRPIVVCGERAVIGRPPENVEQLL